MTTYYLTDLFRDVNQGALQNIKVLLGGWLPGGRYVGHEYVVKNPTRYDRQEGSFKINTLSGKWRDFATNDGGSDVVSLYKYIFGISSRYKAAKLLKQDLRGYDFASSSGTASKPSKPPKVVLGNYTLKAQQLWHSSKEANGTFVARYLESRSLILRVPMSLRFHPNLLHVPTQRYYPAMIGGVVRWPDPQIIAIHRTYLAVDGKGKAAISSNKMMLGSVEGGAVRFGTDLDVLAIAEGIETALSIYQSTGITTWATLSASGFKNLILPPPFMTKNIIIAADHDDAGKKAAYEAADRWTKEGRIVKIALPPKGLDFNDVLRGF
jgi:hypothetical protein